MLDQISPETYASPIGAAPQPSCDPAILALALRLSMMQGKLLCVLMANTLTTAATIEQHLGVTPEGRRTLLFRLRARLGPHKINIISNPSLGYSILAEDRQRVQRAVERCKGQFS